MGLKFSFSTLLGLFAYAIRWTVYLGSITTGGYFYALYFLCTGRKYENAWHYAQFFDRVAKLMGIRTRYVGRENFNPDKPCIIIMNHQSFLDPLVMADIWPKRACAIMKDSLKWAGPFGIICKQAKTYFINRKDRASSLDVLNKAADHIKKEHCSLIIFPEGTRSNGKNLLPFKKGAFHIAVQTQYPIQPIVASSFLNFMDHSELRFNSAQPVIHVLPQIKTEGKSVKDVDELLNLTYERMNKVFVASVPDKYIKNRSD